MVKADQTWKGFIIEWDLLQTLLDLYNYGKDQYY